MRNGSNGLNSPVAGHSNSSGGGDFGFGMGPGTFYAPEGDGGGGDSGGSSGGDDGGQGSSDVQAQIDAAVETATAGLKTNRDEAISRGKKTQQKYDTLATELADLKKTLGATGGDLSKVSDLLKKANDDEERELIKAGDIDGLVDRRLKVERGNNKHQLDTLATDIGTLKAENENLVQTNRGLLIGGDIRREAELQGVIPEAIDIAVAQGMSEFQIENGKTVAKNEDGTTRFGADNKTEYGPADYVEGLKKTHAFMFPGSEGGGSQGNQNPGLKGAKETYSKDDWLEKTAKATDEERKALIAKKHKGEIVVT